MSTYRAFQVTGQRQFELAERELLDPQPGHVRFRVQSCGVCHSDVLAVEGLRPDPRQPVVPGHEVVGVIDALGDEVTGWSVGDRVGVGFLGGHCGVCVWCRHGDFVNCEDQPRPGPDADGGYAEGGDARASALVAIQGFGGLGPLGVQYANKLGYRVAAIARGTDKAALADKLGAHHYIDSAAVDPAKALQELGGAVAIVATAASGASMSPLLAGLAPRGQLVVVGVGDDPIEVNASD